CSAVPARPPSPTPFPYTTLFRSADVPQRDVDRAHHLARRPTAAHVGERPEDRVPEVLDAGRVRPGDEVVDLPHHVRDRAVRAGGGRGDLTPPAHALVGPHLDEEELPPVGPGRAHEPGHDLRDPHGPPSTAPVLRRTRKR